MDQKISTVSPITLRADDSFDEDTDGQSGHLQYSWDCKKCSCLCMYRYVQGHMKASATERQST